MAGYNEIDFNAGAINCLGEQPELHEPEPIAGFRIEQLYTTTIAIPKNAKMFI